MEAGAGCAGGDGTDRQHERRDSGGNSGGADDATVVLVDARNVLRSRWPNVPERELVDVVHDWARQEGHRAVLAFDGRAPGGHRGVRELDEHGALVGTGGETADDWLVREAGRCRDAGRSYWLVSSDREVRDAAGAAAQKVVGGGGFLGMLGLDRRQR